MERFGKTRAHGCRPLPDSAWQARPKKGGVQLDAWFRSPVGLNRHGYLLRYSRPLQVDQHRLHHTRFIYAGPKNEPSQNGPSQNGPFDSKSLERGCDEVVFAYRQIPLTADPLSATLDTLFSIDRDSVGGHRHFLARTNETLSLRGVFRDGPALEVRLEGRLSGLRGMCDHPRARIQIVETARRVGAVDSVALYLNGTPTELQPGGRGS